MGPALYSVGISLGGIFAVFVGRSQRHREQKNTQLRSERTKFTVPIYLCASTSTQAMSFQAPCVSVLGDPGYFYRLENYRMLKRPRDVECTHRFKVYHPENGAPVMMTAQELAAFTRVEFTDHLMFASHQLLRNYPHWGFMEAKLWSEETKDMLSDDAKAELANWVAGGSHHPGLSIRVPEALRGKTCDGRAQLGGTT